MKFIALVGTQGRMPKEAVEIMNAGFPAYMAEMEPRGVRVLGRELDFPETAVTVRVRGGRTLVTDGPFVETKEYVAGFDVLDCADIDEAIEVEGKSPVAQFLPFEIRPLRGDLRLGPGTGAFGDGDDGSGIPYMLTTWVDHSGGGDDAPEADAYEAWRAELEQAGPFILGAQFGDPQSFRTLRPRDGKIAVAEGSFLPPAAQCTGLDVIRCPDRDRAAALAATHPFVQSHAIEVRPFYVAPA